MVARQLVVLICHAEDGRFADGDRQAVRQVLTTSPLVAHIRWGEVGCALTCIDGGRVTMRSAGFRVGHPFHRLDLILESGWTQALVKLVYHLMREGGFGLVDNLDVPQFLVTRPEQIIHFPWLPDPPVLARNPYDLGYLVGIKAVG